VRALPRQSLWTGPEDGQREMGSFAFFFYISYYKLISLASPPLPSTKFPGSQRSCFLVHFDDKAKGFPLGYYCCRGMRV
jgi:hypothetical protein